MNKQEYTLTTHPDTQTTNHSQCIGWDIGMQTIPSLLFLIKITVIKITV